MTHLISIFLVMGFLAIGPVTLHAQDGIRDLVVKIHAIHHSPDVLRPWTKNSPQQVKGSGVSRQPSVKTGGRTRRSRGQVDS